MSPRPASLLSLRAVVPLLAAATAAAALIETIVGAHFLEMSFGMAAPETTTVWAVILAATALGLRSAMRWAMFERGRRRGPLQAYGFAQMALAAVGIATWAALPIAARAFAAIGGVVASLALLSILRIFLCSLILLPGVLLLGASLALLSRAYVCDSSAERDLGILISALALGAASGVALAVLVLLPELGFRGTWLVAAGLNLALGLLTISRRARDAGTEEPSARWQADSASLSRPFLVLSALVGFVAFSIPALWRRALLFSIGDSACSSALVLVTILCGAAIGSMVAMILVRRIRRPLFALAFAQTAAALAIVVTTSVFDDLVSLRAASSLLSARFLACMLAVLAPAILLGMGATFVFAAAARTRQDLAQDIDLLAAASFAGAAGAIAVTFLMIPTAGIRGSLLMMAAISSLTGIFALGLLRELPRSRRLAIAAGFAVLFAMTASVLPPWNAKVLAHGSSAEQPAAGHERILEAREGRTASVIVKRHGSDLELNVNGASEASVGLDLKSNTLLGILPFVFQPRARSVLVMGLGTGATLSVVAHHSLQSIECVEPLEEVIAAAPRFAPAIAQSGVKIRHESARGHLLSARKKYDVIVVQPPRGAGSRRFFTQQFVQLCRHRLAEDGVLAIRIAGPSSGALRSILATLLGSFPFVDLWASPPDDVLVTASKTSLPLSFETIARVFDGPAEAVLLRNAGVGDASILLSHHLLDSGAVRQFSQAAPRWTDDRPSQEEWCGAVGEPRPSVLPELLAFQTDVHQRISDPVLLPAGSEASARVERAGQARRFEIEGFARDTPGRSDEALQMLRQAVAANPNDLAIRRNLARLCVRMGAQSLREQNYGAAYSHFTEAIQADRESVDAALGLGELSVIAGNPEDALQWAHRVLELDPQSDVAYAQIGDAYRALERWSEARDAYLQALERFPDDIPTTLHLAEALTHTGDPEGAVAKLEKARRLGAPADEMQRIRKQVRQDG